MDKFIVTRALPKPKYHDLRHPIRVPVEAYQIIKKIAEETRRPQTEIILRMTLFCQDRLEIIDERTTDENGNHLS